MLNLATKKRSFNCVRVRQPIGDFYVAAIPWTMLREISYADVRHLEKRDLDSFIGIQRELNPARVNELKKYVRLSDATFPTAIILSIDELCATFDEVNSRIDIEPYSGDDENEPISYGAIARILDGQHRIAGLEDFEGPEFDLNVAIFIGADIADQASIFSTVNLEQTKVRKSLAYDLLEVARTRSPEKTCHNAAVVLDSMPESPLYKRIKRLGVATPGRAGEKLTQATFVKGLLRLITEDSISDRDALMRKQVLPLAGESQISRTPFRNLFITECDSKIAQCVLDYFSAISKRWPQAWSAPEQSAIISRSTGYLAFMRYLRTMLGDARLQLFTEAELFGILLSIELSDADFVSSVFLPGAGGQGRLFRSLRARALVH